MNIAIEARALSMQAGVHTYVGQLLRHLAALQLGDEVTVIRDRPGSSLPDMHSAVLPLQHPLLLPWWMNVTVPRYLDTSKPDIVHFTKAAVPSRKVVPTVVTIHDLVPLFLPETQSFTRRLWWPRAFRRAVEGSDHIITISEASKQDIVRLLNVDPVKISVTQLGVDRSVFHPDIQPEKISGVVSRLAVPRPYILFVGTRDMRKNISSLIRAFARLAPQTAHHLVIAGQVAYRDDESRSILSSATLRNRVRFLDFVAQPDLPALYAGADLFVWPSAYEGWGLPPQEAMASGVPVIVSNGGSLPEVVGQAGEIVPFSTDVIGERLHDDRFTQRLADTIGSVLADAARRQRMRVAGLAQVSKFSWNEVAKKTYEVYTKVAQHQV